jgi:hypothetical protein
MGFLNSRWIGGHLQASRKTEAIHDRGPMQCLDCFRPVRENGAPAEPNWGGEGRD